MATQGNIIAKNLVPLVPPLLSYTYRRRADIYMYIYIYVYIYIYLYHESGKKLSNIRDRETRVRTRLYLSIQWNKELLLNYVPIFFFSRRVCTAWLATRTERFSLKPNPGVTKIEIGGRTGARQGAHVRRRRRSSTHIIRTVFRVAIVCAFPGLSSLRNY